MQIGRKIREAREAAGLTQEELAARIGVSQRAVSYAERQSWMSRRALERYAAALSKRLSYFLQEEPQARSREEVVGGAFEVVRRDPEFGFGARSAGDFDLDAQEAIVRLYERAKGVRLLPSEEKG